MATCATTNAISTLQGAGMVMVCSMHTQSRSFWMDLLRMRM
uniref:Uncharacterized protein n=1 Tax=Setaria italica TaxID=4555 RepID=K3XUQ0_SETIT